MLQQFVSVSVSVLTLTFISVDRWYAICRPLKFKSTITKTRLAIIFIWIVSLAINSPDLLYLETISIFHRNETIYYTDCVHNWSEKSEKIYQLWIVTTYFLLPIILMSVAYHQIAIVLWNKNIPGSGETGHHYHSTTPNHHHPSHYSSSHHFNNSSQSKVHSNNHHKSYPESSSSIEMHSTNLNNNNNDNCNKDVTSKRSDYGGKSGKGKSNHKRNIEDSQLATNGGHKRTVTSKNTSKYPYDSQVTSRQRVAKMLIAVVIMFGLCYLPVHVLNTLRCFISIPQNDVISILSLSSHWLCYANSAINPIIYNFMSAKFRKEFHSTFQNLCGLRSCRNKRRFQGSAMESGTRRQSNQTQFENINLNSVARYNGS